MGGECDSGVDPPDGRRRRDVEQFRKMVGNVLLKVLYRVAVICLLKELLPRPMTDVVIAG